ncbi:response regulator [Pirellulaceae bacterium SH449]
MSAKILVVDDSATIRQQVGDILLKSGFQVVEANDGISGMREIEKGDVQCVICDVKMPNKDGIEMVEEVKNLGQFQALPILMLTTDGAPDLIRRAKAAGASGWMVKPFKPDMLVAAVKKLVGIQPT